MKWLVLTAAAALMVLTAAAQPSPSSIQGTQVHDAASGFMQDRSARFGAEQLFVEKCGMCHRQMGMGTLILARRMPPSKAMLEQRDDLTPDFILTAARTGIGNMPRISRGEVSDAQLGTIAAYLAKGKK